MVTAHAGAVWRSGEISLEDPNSPVVIVGQVLCILVPLIVWLAPLPLEPVTQHALAIVGFMVVAWITPALDYELAGVGGLVFFSAACCGRCSGGLDVGPRYNS